MSKSIPPGVVLLAAFAFYESDQKDLTKNYNKFLPFWEILNTSFLQVPS